MTDYSDYPINTNVFLAGAEQKCEIMIDGFRYIMKYQKNSEIGLTYNHVSEYLGSHVFALLDIPVQDTFLGTYRGRNVVLMKHFCGAGERLVPFNDVGESTLEQDKELYQYSYEDIEQMLRDNTKSTDISETIQRFWDMFIVDALNGNFDRHGGNWGFIRKDNRYRIAPVYDNGSSMYPRLNTDEALLNVLQDSAEIDRRIYMFPTSHIKLDGRKSSYYDIIHSLRFSECNAALKRIVPRFDLTQIHALADSIEGISDTRKHFYKTMYEERYRKILLTSYQKLTEASR